MLDIEVIRKRISKPTPAIISSDEDDTPEQARDLEIRNQNILAWAEDRRDLARALAEIERLEDENALLKKSAEPEMLALLERFFACLDQKQEIEGEMRALVTVAKVTKVLP
jgi:hypothetical protein